jgi:hypothetical protein
MDTALLLLKQLYEMSDGSVDYEANFNVIAAKLNLDCVERDNAFRSLLNRSYILNSGMGYGCSITREGIAVVNNMNSSDDTSNSKRWFVPRFNFRIADYFSLPKVLDFK